jgi:glycosyltransferase involved in cell wall biosynthesis
VPNGIECARFTAAPPSGVVPRLPWTGIEPVIGTVAGLRAEKNLHRLLRAVRLVMQQAACRLVIVGDGPQRHGLEAFAAELGIRERVFFTGYAQSPQAYYSLFDIFALSSDTEQMPYVIVEAMAAGLPIAATQVGDIPYLVAPENMVFLTARADDALARALLELAQDGGLRRRIGAANRSKALREYDERPMLVAWKELFGGVGAPPR